MFNDQHTKKIFRSAFLVVGFLNALSIRVVALQQQDSIPQKDMVDVIYQTFHLEGKNVIRDTKNVRYSIIPISASASGGKSVLVSALSAAFYLGASPETYLSNVFLVPYFDFKGSGGIFIRPNLWTDKNRWNITGELQLGKNYAYAYPLGSTSSMDERSTVKFNQLSLYAVFHRQVIKDFFMGGGIELDYFSSIEEQDPGIEDSAFKEYGIGTSGKSMASGLSVNLLRDSRANSINAEKGFYTTLIFRFQNENALSDNTWSSLYFDGRKYFSFHEVKHQVLAFWILYWGTFGEVPYLNLPGTALDFSARTGRGYASGRYRGKQMLYGETEYRFDISPNGLWGGVVFANVQSLTEPESNKFEYLKIGGGAGVRLKFDKKSNTNLTLDFGIGKDSFNVRLNLGEVF